MIDWACGISLSYDGVSNYFFQLTLHLMVSHRLKYFYMFSIIFAIPMATRFVGKPQTRSIFNASFKKMPIRLHEVLFNPLRAMDVYIRPYVPLPPTTYFVSAAIDVYIRQGYVSHAITQFYLQQPRTHIYVTHMFYQRPRTIYAFWVWLFLFYLWWFMWIALVVGM